MKTLIKKYQPHRSWTRVGFGLVGLIMSGLLLSSCAETNLLQQLDPYFDWAGATIYFMLTDRFNNGDPTNDVNFNRTEPTAVLRGFEGGDLAESSKNRGGAF